MNIFSTIVQKLKDNKIELITLICLMLLSGVAHGYNMFHYPYYENDEGTYMSQAWAILNMGKLAPYTYWYDHAPFGWVVIALWTTLTGGFFTFGTSVNSGRVLMLVIHLASSVLLFYIAKRLTKGSFAGIIAVLIFSLSPLAIYYQRRVLLDNIMIFWVLLSLFILLREKLKLTDIVMSAILFAVALLTKENAIFFIPAFIYVLSAHAHKHHKSFAIGQWLIVSGFITSFYFLYAYLKGELFPPGFMGDTSQHVSLIGTLQSQMSRGVPLPFWNKQSDFYLTLIEWIHKDPLTVLGGAIITIINLILCLRVKKLRTPVLFAVFFWLFLMRGKLVINFYIIPLLSLLALNIGIFADILIKFLSFKSMKRYQHLVLITISAIMILFATHDLSPYTKDETTPQLQALDWVFKNVPKESVIAIDDFAEVDYRHNGYTSAWWFWKISFDSDIQNKFGSDWKNIEYIYLSHEMLKQMGSNPNSHTILIKAFQNSTIQTKYGPSRDTYLDIDKYVTTNGDWGAVYKLQPMEEITFESSWQFYKKNFIHSYGQVIDPANGNTTSEGQSYAMLRSVWLNDKETFNGVWQWSKDHIQYRSNDRLFSWLWKDNKVADSATASDADLDVALALIFAGRRWNDERYTDEAYEMIEDVWEQDIVRVNGTYYLLSGDGAERSDGYILNPSYFSPATYRIFAELDKSHPWNELAEDTYTTLNAISNQSSTGLPPNWVLLKKDGTFTSASSHVSGTETNVYGFDAFRTLWRIGLDATWFDSPAAHLYLNRLRPFFTDEWKSQQRIRALYPSFGDNPANFESLSTTTGAFSLFAVEDKGLAEDIHNRKIKSVFHEDGYWGSPTNYYDQNWVWFSTALYFGDLKKY